MSDITKEDLKRDFEIALEEIIDLKGNIASILWELDNEDWDTLVHTLKMSKGYGYFDDDYHLNRVMEYLDSINYNIDKD